MKGSVLLGAEVPGKAIASPILDSQSRFRGLPFWETSAARPRTPPPEAQTMSRTGGCIASWW